MAHWPPVLLLQAAASLPHDVAPWVAVALALIAIVPQVIQALRGGGGDTKKLAKAIENLQRIQSEHGGSIGALKQHAEAGHEKTDPALTASRAREQERLEQRVAVLEAELKEQRIKNDRRAEEDARADKELNHHLGRIAGLLEAQNGRR